MDPEKTSIVFVDDDSSLLASLRRSLHRFRHDWQMEFCPSAKEALHHLEEKQVDVVVSDIRMPNMDGTELMQAVARNHQGVIRFILSGQAEKETILKLVDDVHQYFAKLGRGKQLPVAGSLERREHLCRCASFVTVYGAEMHFIDFDSLLLLAAL